MENRSEINPYQSPAASAYETTSASHEVANEDATETRGYIAWGVVFAGNLLIPLLVGWGVTQDGGRWGMLAAVALLFVVGCWLCAAVPRVARALLVGSVAVGLTQAIPVLQLMAGIAALGLVELLRLDTGFNDAAPRPHTMTNELSGFVATLVTGGLLMTAALVAGLAIRGLLSKWGSR